jgi:hypothetical protein
MLWVALEFRHPSGRWEEIQWEDIDRTIAPENPEYKNLLGSTNSRIYFIRDYTTGFSEVQVEIDATDFYSPIATAFKATGNEASITLRQVYKDDLGNEIEGLSSVFDLDISYDGSSECADVSLRKQNQVDETHRVAFKESDEWSVFTLDKPLEVEKLDANSVAVATTACPVEYQLHVYDNDYLEWRLWADVEAELYEEDGLDFMSHFKADMETGNFMMEISRADVEELSNMFAVGTETIIYFQIAAVTPGSVNAGADVELRYLPTASFAVHLIDDAQVNTCAQNQLALRSTTASGNTRDDLIEW